MSKFSQDLKSGKITYREVNINAEEDTTVWRLVVNETQMKNYFEAKLKALL